MHDWNHAAYVLQGGGSLIARALLGRVGGLSSGFHFGANSELHRRAAHMARIRNIPEVGYYRLMRRGSLTSAEESGRRSNARRNQSWRVNNRSWENLPKARRGSVFCSTPLSGPDGVAAHNIGPKVTR